MRKHIRYFLTMSLSLFSHPSDRYDYKALALKPASDTAERIVSAGRSVVIVNVLSGDSSRSTMRPLLLIIQFSADSRHASATFSVCLKFNVAISLLII